MRNAFLVDIVHEIW